LYTKSGAATQEEKLEFSLKEQIAKRAIQPASISVGDFTKCPECTATGRVVWVSPDHKTMGVRCPASHRGYVHESKYGATSVTVTKARKDVVFLTPVGK
jgi:hypothetical protein